MQQPLESESPLTIKPVLPALEKKTNIFRNYWTILLECPSKESQAANHGTNLSRVIL